MSPSTKRALIIACPFAGLQGPLNDANALESILQTLNFEISKCYGPNATRDGILEAWKTLISVTSAEDTIVIYYSGHGGLLRPPREDKTAYKYQHLQQYQFIVPTDYDKTIGDDFRGILDIEISYMLRETTEKTRNVTVLLDCCHAGKMFRAPENDTKARSKSLPEVKYHDVASFLVRQQGYIRRDLLLSGNPHAVRIAAAGTDEVAWEHMNPQGKWMGIFTESFTKAMQVINDTEISWGALLFQVCKFVNDKFRNQYPHVEGPETRIMFSLRQMLSGPLYLNFVNGKFILHGGSIVGVLPGNVYSIIPFNRPEETNVFPEAEVTAVNSFFAQVKLNMKPEWEGFQAHGALAIPKQETHHKQSIVVPQNLDCLLDAINRSRYLYACETNSEKDIKIQHQGDIITLHNRQGDLIISQHIKHITVAPWQEFVNLVTKAEKLARAQRVLDLQCKRNSDRLEHKLSIEIGTVKDGEPHQIFQKDGNDQIMRGDHIYMKLKNENWSTVYVSIFNINASGHIMHMTPLDPMGLEIGENPEILGAADFGFGLEGLEVSWPKDIPEESPIGEEYLFIITSSPINLSYLCDSMAYDPAASRDTSTVAKSSNIYFDIIHIRFKIRPFTIPQENLLKAPLHDSHDEDKLANVTMPLVSEGQESNPTLAAALPEPEIEDFSLDSLAVTPKGLLGGIFRTLSRIPPYVWVVNEHDEEITVVVSQYRPNQMLSGISIGGSATGISVAFDTTTFIGPATKKILSPRTDNMGCRATFPLWTHNEGFGVISIFKGVEKILYIDNDRIPIGSTVYFQNKPDLEIKRYKE